jgi:hypothetical protein
MTDDFTGLTARARKGDRPDTYGPNRPGKPGMPRPKPSAPRPGKS